MRGSAPRVLWLLLAVPFFSGCVIGFSVGAVSPSARLQIEARGLYEQGEYQRAAAAYRQALRHDEHDLIARYNLSCSLALAGETEAALEQLERAVRAGLSDRPLIEGDEDLRTLRASPRFAAILTMADGVLSEQRARSRLLLPSALAADERVPLVVFLHGHLGRPADVVEALRSFVEVQRVALLVPAGGQVFRKPCGTEVYAWLAHDLVRISAEVSDLVAQGRLDPERITVAGFSGGATMALRLGLTRPGLYRGVFALAGHLQEDWFKRFIAAGTPPRRVPVVLVHGAADRAIPPSASRRTAELLEQAGYLVQVHVFPGGHHFPADLSTRLSMAMTWLAGAGERGGA